MDNWICVGIGKNRKMCMDKIRFGKIYMVELDGRLSDTWPGNETRGCKAREVVVK